MTCKLSTSKNLSAHNLKNMSAYGLKKIFPHMACAAVICVTSIEPQTIQLYWLY